MFYGLADDFLQAHPHRRLAASHCMFQLAPAGGFLPRLLAWSCPPQSVCLLQTAHYLLLPPIVVAVADHAAVVTYTIDNQMDVLMLLVRMPDGDILVAAKSHVLTISGGNFPPLFVRQAFTRGQGNADVAHRTIQILAEPSDFPEFPRQPSRVLRSHIAVQQIALFRTKIVLQDSSEASPFNRFGYHGALRANQGEVVAQAA